MYDAQKLIPTLPKGDRLSDDLETLVYDVTPTTYVNGHGFQSRTLLAEIIEPALEIGELRPRIAMALGKYDQRVLVADFA